VAVGDAGRGHVPESPAWFEGRYVCMMHIDGGQRAHLALSAHLARRSARGGAVGLCGQRPGEKSAREGQQVVGDDRAPVVGTETRESRPRAASQAEGPETVASMPARKRLRMRRTRGVEVIFSTETPAGFEKQASRVPADWSASRFAFDANPPSKAARWGRSPKSAAWRSADRTAKVESAGFPFSTTRSRTIPLRPVEIVIL